MNVIVLILANQNELKVFFFFSFLLSKVDTITYNNMGATCFLYLPSSKMGKNVKTSNVRVLNTPRALRRLGT